MTDADLESQFDILHTYFVDALNSSTGHAHTGSSNQGPKLSALASLTFGASQATGDIIYASSASVIARLGIGTATQVLHGGTIPSWSALAIADLPSGSTVQIVNTSVVTSTTGTTAMVDDDTIPQNTEGDEYMTLAITPTSATNKLLIEVLAFVSAADASRMIGALYQDSTANALNASWHYDSIGSAIIPIVITHYMTAGTTSSTTFKFRAGAISATTTTFNGYGGARKLGGVLTSSITIKEIKV